MTKEFTLPSGRIATLRPMTWWDKVSTANANVELMIFSLACRVVMIDKKPLTLEVAQEMPLHEAAPIISAISAAWLEAMGLNKQEVPADQAGAQLH